MKHTVSFIGLGVMGYPMAAYLAKAGHDVRVYNRTTGRAEQWIRDHGGCCAATPAKAAADCDFVFCCVGNDEDVRSVTTGEHGAFHGMKPGAVFACCDVVAGGSDHWTGLNEAGWKQHLRAAEFDDATIDHIFANYRAEDTPISLPEHLTLLREAGWISLGILGLLTALSLAIGHVMGGPDEEDRTRRPVSQVRIRVHQRMSWCTFGVR